MNMSQLAARMGIARPGVNRLIRNEMSGSITLASLQKAADAMDCDVRYVLEPRRPLSEIVYNQAVAKAQATVSRVNGSQALEASALDSGSLSRAVVDLTKEFEVQRPSDLWDD